MLWKTKSHTSTSRFDVPRTRRRQLIFTVASDLAAVSLASALGKAIFSHSFSSMKLILISAVLL